MQGALPIPNQSSSASLQAFNFDGAEVRVTMRDGEPWWVLADVCRVLSISNPSDAARRLDNDERYTLDNVEGIASGRVQALTLINESGLWSTVLTSRKEEAKRFKKWITAEVIPSIRKNGSYGAPTLPDLDDPTTLKGLLLKNLDDKIRLEAQVAQLNPKATAFDRFINSDGLFGLQNAGRALGIGPNRFISKLKQGYLFYQGGHLVPKAVYRDQGLFEVKVTFQDDKARHQTYLTPKGMQYFAEKIPATKLVGTLI